MNIRMSLILSCFALAFPAMAQDTSDNDAVHEDAVSQLVGSWQSQLCAQDGSCATVERTYEPVGDDGLVHYTEMFGGEENEGFVAYDEDSGGFHELDYPADWDRDRVASYYDNDPSMVGFDDPESTSRVMEWRVSDDGDSMSINAFGDTVIEESSGPLSAIFTRVQQLGE